MSKLGYYIKLEQRPFKSYCEIIEIILREVLEELVPLLGGYYVVEIIGNPLGDWRLTYPKYWEEGELWGGLIPTKKIIMLF